jgi:formate dehydrogenase major subunit
MTRRDFLKTSGVTGGALAGLFAMEPVEARAAQLGLRIHYADQSTSICPYCGCGCGLIVAARNGRVVNIEGDPDHPINEGALCSKGSALYQVANNDRRLTHVLYRAPHSDRWEKKSWTWAINRISAKIKASRDKGLSDGRKNNRVENMAALGGAALDNEECYLYSKFMRALGLVWIEHQARI